MLLALLTLGVLAGSVSRADCPLLPQPAYQANLPPEDGGPASLVRVWEFPADPRWWTAETVPEERAVTAFRAWVATHLEYDLARLMVEQREMHREFARRTGKPFLDVWTPILRGEVGRLAPAGCLERRLLGIHLQTHAGNRQTEFEAHVLTRGSRMRIYLQSALPPDFGAGPPAARIRQRVAQDVGQGWALPVHLHFHPFLLEGRLLIPSCGALAPSGDATWGDLRVYALLKQAGLAQARITNGLDTFALPMSELQRLVVP